VPVTVATPAGTPALSSCARLATALPEAVNGQKRRRTDPGSPRTAAWGAPPIVLRCGVGRPAGLEPTSLLETVDGVDWYADRGADATVFTTVGRVAAVQVSVPADYDPTINALTDLARPITEAVPEER
jgi:hypothetical protein